MISFFSWPFPYTEELSRKFYAALGIAFLVMFFLYIFRPFGLSSIDQNPLLVCSGFGAVTLITSMITNLMIPSFFPGIFNEKSWTVGKEIIYTLLVILIIATSNLLFTSWLGFRDLSVKMFFYFELITLAVAALPVTLLVLIRQNILLKRTLKSALHISKNLYQKERLSSKTGELITIPAENPKETLVIEASSLYYIISTDNYVEVYYSLNNEVVKKLIRTTMRNAQSNLKRFSQFYRCHRSYIVNLEKVKKVTGNAQGYQLILEDVDEQIAVSRSMNQEITLRLSR